MSLLREIQRQFPDSVGVLRRAGFTSDSELGSLDSTDLHELFPGVENIILRHDMFVIIHHKSDSTTYKSSEKGTDLMMKINSENPEAAIVLESWISTNEGLKCILHHLDQTDLYELLPGVDKLKMRKDIFKIIKPQMPVDTSQPSEVNSKKGSAFFGNLSMGIEPKKEVKYKILDGGKPLGVYSKVISKVTSKNGVRFVNTDSDHKVSLLFCPIISRFASDAEAAIATISDDKPVIMVVLIHSLKAQTLSLLKCWDDSSNIVLHVHLFYQTKSGLLSCKENKSAISAIQRKLLDYAVDLKEDGAGERSQS